MAFQTETLYKLCAYLYNTKIYDFSTPLQVQYRAPGINLDDEFIGCCHVSGKYEDAYNEMYFSITSDDGYNYNLTDEVMLWKWDKEKSSLQVWTVSD